MTDKIVIAGGGLAGAAAACELARAGHQVVVLERSTGPTHKICGEFLSAEAQHYVQRLGLDLGKLGGHPIARVRVVRGERRVEAELPFRALGLSRFALDEALLVHAASLGAEIVRGHVLEHLPPEVRFLATGKHDLRGARRDVAAPPEALVGFKMHYRLSEAVSAALAGIVEVILFADGYAGLQMIEGGTANLCLLVHRNRLVQAGGTWEGLLADLTAASPHLRQRLYGAAPQFERPLTVARVPYGFIHRATPGETVFRLGDQACVIPSFTGDGMAMALHSAALAVACHETGGTPAQYHQNLARDVAGPIRRAAALYAIGRNRTGQAALMQALAFCPSVLRVAASATRVSQTAWLHTAQEAA